MIYTVTFNPSIDYIATVNNFELHKTNRTSDEKYLAGGKGINVSTVLNNLGVQTTALGFVAGFTGKAIAQEVEDRGIKSEFIELDKGLTRINLKIKNYDGTEINGMGPVIPYDKIEQMYEILHKLTAHDYLVLAGSIPSSMPNDSYEDIIKITEPKGINVVVDATGKLLLNTLQYHPFLIKPNSDELAEIFDAKITTHNQVVPYAKKLKQMGARNIIVSMGGKGAVCLTENNDVYFADAPDGELINAVGAGDSMVAGFLAGIQQKNDCKHAFKMAVAAGSASAFSENLATKQQIDEIYNRCKIITFALN